MDTLDRVSLWAIVLLVISSSALISHNMGEAKPHQNNRGTEKVNVTDSNAELAAGVRAAKNLMEGANLSKAELLVRELKAKYPYEGEPKILMGDIFMRRQEVIKAALEYKEAVDLNPDYLDRKTPTFQGKKLKITVNEALIEVNKRIKDHPADEDMKKTRKEMYYLQRRIAGSCG